MNNFDSYLSPDFTVNNLDLYYHRCSVLQALEGVLPPLSGTLLDVGCGNMPYRSLFLGSNSAVSTYIGMDIPNPRYSRPDLYWDGKTIPLTDASVDCVIATELLEHCPYPDRILASIFRVLKPAGLLFFTVPFLWPLHDVPYDEFRFTPFAMQRLLQQAGFDKNEIRALGGWDASMAQMIGLWVRRRPMPKIIKVLLSFLAYPAVRFLIRQDKPPATFHKSSMITGLTGIARKQHVPFEL